MMRENIFLEDIEIPEIVQEKADIAFSAVKMEGMCRENMKKENQTIKRKEKRMGSVAAAAACVAVVVTAGFLQGQDVHRMSMQTLPETIMKRMTKSLQPRRERNKATFLTCLTRCSH